MDVFWREIYKETEKKDVGASSASQGRATTATVWLKSVISIAYVSFFPPNSNALL